MGLLDSLTDDPTMSFAMGLLNASGPSARPVSLGQGIAQGYGAMSEAKKNQQAAQLQALQLQHMSMQMDAEKQKMADADALRNFDFSQYYQSPQQQAIANGGPTIENAAKIPTLQHHFDQAGMIRGLMQSKSPVLMQKGMEMLTKEDAPIALADGGMLVTRSGKTLVANPKDVAPSDFTKLAREVAAMPEGPMKALALQRLNTMSTHAPGASVTVMPDNLGLKPKDRFEMEDKLRNDYSKAIDLDTKMLSSVSKLKSVLSGDPNAMKDQSAIYSFAKTLDPDGAVRESDYAAVMNTAGLSDRIKNYLNKLKTGQVLSATQRAEMIGVADAWEQLAKNKIASQQKSYASRAKMYNLLPENIFQVQPMPETSKTPTGKSGWSATVIEPNK